jgi:SAM-dependent methyltransferase|tara:strand:- start:2 stop:760 length:759 start_codon:yes stop_codon:yes gene_type:complete
MKPALAFRQPHYPQSWQSLPNGELVLAEINQQLKPWWPKFFGYHLLKIGALSGYINTADSTIKHQIAVSHTGYTNREHSQVIADIDDLPMLEQSVDVCLLSHCLEFALDPHHVVREANRVLIPNGYLVITGFNPFSLAGLNFLIPYRNKKSPWNERFFSPMRVKDWLHLMGFEILADQRCLHTTLVGHVNEGYVASHWRDFANSFLSNLGSVYIIVAKKRVLPLTPIKPKWKIRPKFQPVKVSTMNSSHLTK